MSFRHCLIVCTLFICMNCVDFVKAGPKRMFPLTRFSCTGKAPGYYADVDTGCQVYHMCDGMGRQFSYKCPNMTLFQQRMLICDHWYMVNCSMSERDYDANLLIGQRDKPFVSDDEMHLRTPRPDILSVPPYNPYFDVLKVDTKLHEVEDNDLDTRQTQNHFRPNDVNRREDIVAEFDDDNNDQVYDEETTRIPKKNLKNKSGKKKLKIGIPAFNLLPPFSPLTDSSLSEEDLDDTTAHVEVPVFKFLKRFDPTSNEDPKTTISQSDILELNSELPEEQVSDEEDRSTRKLKNFDNSESNSIKNEKTFSDVSRFTSNNIKTKPAVDNAFKTSQKKTGVAEPAKILLPPKIKSEPFDSTTIGPPIYYEWRWAAPAFGLVPPKENNETDSVNTHQTRQVVSLDGRNPFSAVTRPEPITTTPEPSHVEYNISSYFVPDYVFPLDKEHPGYESDSAQTSFLVKVARPGRASYGENPKCPQCHPAYLKPGTCEPCIVER